MVETNFMVNSIKHDLEENNFVSGRLSVVIRFHSAGCVEHLEQAVFSLAQQDISDLEVVVAVKNPTDKLISDIEEMVREQPWLYQPAVQICHASMDEKIDARVILLNKGISAATGQYLSFLDFDDAIYPGSFAALLEKLKTTNNGCAAGGSRLSFNTVNDGVMFPTTKFPQPGMKYSRFDLWDENFICIHSYILDRFRIPKSALVVSEDYPNCEDSVLILQISVVTEFDLSLIDTPVCEYRLKRDGTNAGYLDGAPDPAKEKWKPFFIAQEKIKEWKSNTYTRVSIEEIRDYGVSLRKLINSSGPEPVSFQAEPSVTITIAQLNAMQRKIDELTFVKDNLEGLQSEFAMVSRLLDKVPRLPAKATGLALYRLPLMHEAINFLGKLCGWLYVRVRMPWLFDMICRTEK